MGNAPVSSFIAAALRLSLNPDDSLSRAVYNHYLGRGFDRPLPGTNAPFSVRSGCCRPRRRSSGSSCDTRCTTTRQQTAYLQAIHEQIIGFCASKIADHRALLDWWEQQGQNRSLSVDESATTVEITTYTRPRGSKSAWC